MATARRRDEKRKRLLEERKASGLSVAEFARQNGLSAWTIYEWRRKWRGRERRSP